jgi:hypothetical protein
VTVRVVFAETSPEVAVMVVVPAVTAVASPLLSTVATAVLEELQVTEMVTSWVVPSEKVPVAVNCWVVPPGTLGLAGVTAMEDKVAEVTIRVVPPETSPEVAVMIVVPAVRPLAKPVRLTVATAVLDDPQVARAVISLVVPSE